MSDDEYDEAKHEKLLASVLGRREQVSCIRKAVVLIYPSGEEALHTLFLTKAVKENVRTELTYLGNTLPFASATRHGKGIHDA